GDQYRLGFGCDNPERRPGQLRLGESGHRGADVDRRRRIGAVRRAGERDRTDRAHSADAGHAGHGLVDVGTRGRRTGPVQYGQHYAPGGLPGHREMPDHRQGVCGSGRRDFGPVRLARRRHHRDRRCVGDRRHRRPAAAVIKEQSMFEWSDTDLIMRDTIRGFIDKEIRPHTDALETGEISPYPIARKLFSEFGLDVLAAEAVKTMLDKERAKQEAGHEKATGKRSSGGIAGMGAQASMAAVLVSELAGVSLGLLSAVGVSLGLGATTIMSRGTLAQKERWLPELMTLEKIAAWAITEP